MSSLMVYIGSYSAKASPGLHVYQFDESSGELHFVEAVSGLKDPAFIRICDRQNMLYTFSQAEKDNG
jgi:6-phosphogluconolactonase